MLISNRGDKGDLMNIEIEKVENGYLVVCDDRKWVADDPESFKAIVEELLEELDDDYDND